MIYVYILFNGIKKEKRGGSNHLLHLEVGGEKCIMETLILVLFFVVPIIIFVFKAVWDALVFYARSKDYVFLYYERKFGEKVTKETINYFKNQGADIKNLRDWMLVIGLCPVIFSLAETFNVISVTDFTTVKLYISTIAVLWTLNAIVEVLEEMEVRSR